MQLHKIVGFSSGKTQPCETSEMVASATRPMLAGDEGSRETERAEFHALRDFVEKLTTKLIDKDVFTKEELSDLLDRAYGYTVYGDNEP